MKKQLAIVFALLLTPALVLAQQQHKTVPLGTLIDAQSLASSQTFYIGRYHDCGINNSCDATSTTDTSSGEQVLGFSAVRLEISYTHVSDGTITITCTEGGTRATATGTVSTATLSNGTYTLAWSGVVVTPTLTASRIFPVKFNIDLAPVTKCILSHSAAAGSATVTGSLIAD